MKTAYEIHQCVENVLGEIVLFRQKAPGVYEVATKYDAGQIGFANDYYIVELDSPVISDEAKQTGKSLGKNTGIVFFDIDDTPSGKFIIEYELALYRKKAGLPLEDISPIHEIVTFGREYHPDYFGEYPVPAVTPWGYSTRYRKIENGIYWLDTDKGQSVLALSYPFWNCELSEAAKSYGRHTEDDLKKGINSCMGYLFFLWDDACIPLFELLPLRSHWLDSGMIDRRALMNAIWTLHSEYALSFNATEQAGGHDVLGLLLNTLGADVPLKSSLKEMITITAGAGIAYLKI